MPTIRFLTILILASWLADVGGASPLPAREVSVALRWKGGEGLASGPRPGLLWLQDAQGRVRFFSPREPFQLPPGRYEFRAWGADWVALSPQQLELEQGRQEAVFELKLSKGCTVDLGPLGSESPSELELVAGVGWSFRSSLPVAHPLTVPEGEGVVLVFGKGTLSRWFPYRCSGAQTLRLDPPPPLSPGFGRVLLVAQAAKGKEPGSLQFVARDTRVSARDLPRSPSGKAPLGGRVLAWFEALPVGDYEFTAAGPEVRTSDQRLKLQTGSSPALFFELQSRVSVEVPLVFRAKPPHSSGALQLLRCSSRPLSPMQLLEARSFDRCHPVTQQKIQAGNHTYTFSALDRGLYGLELTVGDQVLELHPGRLPEWAFAISEGDPETVALQAVTLVELEIQGTVLREGTPEPGALLLNRFRVQFSDEKRAVPTQSIGVDNLGRFRASLLGRLWPRQLLQAHLVRGLGELPELSRIASELERVPVAFFPVVAWFHSEKDGSIVPLDSKLLFAGDSDWRIDLPAEAQVELVPVDSVTGAKVLPFRLGMRTPQVRLWLGDRAVAAGTAWGGAVLQEFAAPVTLAIPASKDFAASFSILAEGHQQEDFTLAPTPVGTHRVAQIPLKREVGEAEGSSAIELLGPQGKRLVGAKVLWWDAREGGVHFSCAEESDVAGRLQRSCLEPSEQGFLIHSKVPILPVEARELETSQWKWEGVVQPRTLLLIDSNGSPVTDAEVQIAFDGNRLDPNFFWFVRTIAGMPLPLPDERGLLELPPLRSSDPWTLLLRRPGETEWFEVDLRKHAGSELVIP